MQSATKHSVSQKRERLHFLQRKTVALKKRLTKYHPSVRYLGRRSNAATPNNPLPPLKYRDPLQCDRYDVVIPHLLKTPTPPKALQRLTEADAKSLTVSYERKTMHLAGQQVQIRLTRHHHELHWYAICPACKETTDTLTSHPVTALWHCPTCMPQALHERLAKRALGPIAAASRDLPQHPNPYVQARALTAHLQAVRKQALIIASEVSRVQGSLNVLEARVQSKLREQIQDEIDFERVTHHRHNWRRAKAGETDVPAGMRNYFDALSRRGDTKGHERWPSEQDLLSRQRTYAR